MKKLILLLFYAALFVLANNATASSIPAVQPDSLVDELFIRNYAEQELHITPQQFNTLTLQQRAGIFSRLLKWLGLGGLISGYGQYEEPGRRTEGPYMTFQYADQFGC